MWGYDVLKIVIINFNSLKLLDCKNGQSIINTSSNDTYILYIFCKTLFKDYKSF